MANKDSMQLKDIISKMVRGNYSTSNSNFHFPIAHVSVLRRIKSLFSEVVLVLGLVLL